MINILQKFKDLQFGEPQTDQQMTVIPILGNDRGDIAEPSNITFRKTSKYGTMVFENTDTKVGIIPSNYMTRGKSAQDHAMSGSGIALPGQTSFDNACCVESSQGGMLSGAEQLDILPASLRKALTDISLRQTMGYSKLWPRIKEWLKNIPGISSRDAHLRYFYDDVNYKDAIESFCAAFEPVPNQLGAFILFEGIPVGIEIMPSANHWIEYWELLIRGCYGAELVRLQATNAIKKSSTLIIPNIPDDASAEEIEKLFSNFSKSIQSSMVPLLNAIQITNRESDVNSNGLHIEVLKTDSGGGGDIITQNTEPIYLSIVL
jgi:ARG and Rhodanese-Phosphatase-superfamily-associated Protein domain